MKKRIQWGSVVFSAVCLAVQSSMAATDTPAGAVEQSPWEVGTRITDVMLLQSTKGKEFNGSFVGTLTKLKEEQDYAPIKAYVQYRFMPSLAVGISYDKFGAAAWEQASASRLNPGTDGTMWLSGPLAYVSGRYLNDTRFTPYGELGMAYYFVSFDYSSGWGESNYKYFDLKDTYGLYAAIGCEVKIDDYWSADIYGRLMNVNVNGEFYDYGPHESILFTLSNITLGAGVKYTF